MYVKVVMKDGDNMIFRDAEELQQDDTLRCITVQWLDKEYDRCNTYIPIENIRHITTRPLKKREEVEKDACDTYGRIGESMELSSRGSETTGRYTGNPCSITSEN